METTAGRPIVVGYDGSASARLALRWALDKAAHTGDPVSLVHVMAAPQDPGTWQIELLDRTRRMLERACAEAAEQQPQLTITTDLRVGDPAATLRELSATARMLVVGSRGLGAFSGMLTGSVSVWLATHAHCTVVVVRRPPENLRGLPVVAGFDESPQALTALDVAFAEAEGRDVPVEVVHAWHPPLPDQFAAERLRSEEIAEIESAERRVLHDSVDPVAKRHPRVSVRTHLVAGSASAALTRAAEQAQVVVVGSRGRGAVTGALLGSVGLHLLHHAGCSVMIVRDAADQAT